MLSGLPGVTPTWSMWAEYTTYSPLSFGSVPSRMPIVLGAVVRLRTVSCRSSITRSPATSRTTVAVSARIWATSTPPAWSTAPRGAPFTSTSAGWPPVPPRWTRGR